MIELLTKHARDILTKNMLYANGACILLYDTESPLAKLLAEAYDRALPPEAVRKVFASEEQDSIASMLFDLPKDALVILVQSTNFRLSDFRIRLELFHRGIHVLEHNHLAYIPEEQFETVINSFEYHTPEYLEISKQFEAAIQTGATGEITMRSGKKFTFGALERPRANSGDYSESENRGGTFPIGEIFSECIDLTSTNGEIDIFGYPGMDFQMIVGETFTVQVRNGRIVRDTSHPASFNALMDKIEASEGEIWVREIGIGLNHAISRSNPLSDVNYFERQYGIHLSLGKKHGIYGKKLPKEELQRFHIDVFLDVKNVKVGEFELGF